MPAKLRRTRNFAGVKPFRSCCLGLLAALALALPACETPEVTPPPADLVPRAKMVVLLADLHQLEAQVESSRLPLDSARALYVAQQKALFWKAEVSDSAFQRSYRYYGIHGKDLNDMYTAVVDTLQAREKKLDPKSNATPPHPW